MNIVFSVYVLLFISSYSSTIYSTYICSFDHPNRISQVAVTYMNKNILLAYS